MTHSDYAYAADNQLFQRNPVCGMCWRICMDMCEEWGEGGELYANMRSAASQEECLDQSRQIQHTLHH